MTNSKSARIEGLKRNLYKLLKEDIHSHIQAKNISLIFALTALVLAIGFAFTDFFVAGIGFVIIAAAAFIYRSVFVPNLPEIDNISELYIPVHIVPIADGRFMVIDGSETIDRKSFKVEHLEVAQLTNLGEKLHEFLNLAKHVPVALSSESVKDGELKGIHKEEAALAENINEVLNSLRATKSTEFRLAALHRGCDLTELLKIAEHSSGSGKALHKIPATVVNQLAVSLTGDVNKADVSSSLDEEIRQYAILSDDIFQKYTRTMGESIFMDLQQSMNQFHARIRDLEEYNYCPACNAEYIREFEKGDYNFHKGQHAKSRLVPGTRMLQVKNESFLWECPACSTQSSQPFKRNKLEDDVFTPTFDAMAEEHFKERLEVYNNIADEKRRFAEKAESSFHQVIRESRAQVDIVKSKLRSVRAEVEGDEEAIIHLKNILLKYEQLNAARVRDIDIEIQNIKTEIEQNSVNATAEVYAAIDVLKEEAERKGQEYAALEAIDQKARDDVQRNLLVNSEKSVALQEDMKQIAENGQTLQRKMAEKEKIIKKKEFWDHVVGSGNSKEESQAAGKGMKIVKNK